MNLLALQLFLVLQQPTTPTPAPSGAAVAAPAQEAQAAPAGAAFTPEQLEQIVAPIALHPDTLIAQILMASTYPLEIVEAARWVQKNSSLKGEKLEEALKGQDWDPAVKSICGLPSVLKQMNDNLDWTQDLGDAFLGQKKELMETVQKMRKKALEAGTLKSTEEQKVSEDGDIIIIQSASPEVVYVPTYSPTVVYGSAWSYPSYYYPPMYAPYPPGAPLFSFGMGMVWGAAIWGDCDWHGGDVDIDIDHHNEFNRNTDRNPERNQRDKSRGDKQKFNHDASHRKGVNYRDSKTAQQFGGKQGSNRVTRDQARGYDRGSGSRPSTSNRATAPGGGRTSQKPSPSASTRPSRTSGTAPSRAGSSGSRASTGASSANRGSSALSGSRSPSLDRSASTRGGASRGSSGARASGGGSRSGGGRAGGGGRGGGGGRRR